MGQMDGKIVAVAFVALMIVGSGACFLLFETWSKFNPDEREMSHDYTVTGYWGEEEVTGKGVSEYCNETSLGRLYNFNITVDTKSGEKQIHFGFAFGTDDSPLPNLYKYLGKTEFKGETLDEWTYSENGVNYTMYVGTLCTVKKFVIDSPDYSITGEIIDSAR